MQYLILNEQAINLIHQFNNQETNNFLLIPVDYHNHIVIDFEHLNQPEYEAIANQLNELNLPIIPLPNPVKFMEELADNPLFQQWANTVKSELAFNLMMVAFQNKNLDRVQAYYNALKASYPLPENAIKQWTEIAKNNGIDLTL